MTKKYWIEIEGVPEGWNPIAVKCPVIGEKFLYNGRIRTAVVNSATPELIMEKSQTQQITLENTGRVGRPEEGEYVQNNGNFCKCRKPERWGNEHEIWREVKGDSNG